MLKKGTKVRLKVHVPEGEVKKVTIVDDDQVSYLVEYKDPDGGHVERHFSEAELEVVPDKAKKA